MPNYPVVSTMRLEDNTCYFVDKDDRTKGAKFECEGISEDTIRTFRFPNADITINKANDIQQGDGEVNFVTNTGDMYITNTDTNGNIFINSKKIELIGGTSGVDLGGKKLFKISYNVSVQDEKYIDFILAPSTTAFYKAKITCYGATNPLTQFTREIIGQAYREGSNNIGKTLDTYNTYGDIQQADVNMSVTGVDTIRLTLSTAEQASHKWAGVVEFITNDNVLFTST